jgi:hypothetical protein
MKKALTWYNLLMEKGMVEFEEAETNGNQEETEIEENNAGEPGKEESIT